jgi:pimeloyl-ACP methyl ester carboxylesterase
MPPTPPIVSTRHGSLAYTRRGEGPPLVFFPANGHDARDFDAVRPALSRRFETFAFDWPSMGASPPMPEPGRATAAAFAEMFEDALDALSLPPAVLVGHSVGGFSAARFAARHPSRVRALMLVDAGGFVRPDALQAAFCRVKGTPAATRLAEATFARWYTRARNQHTSEMIARIDRARRRPDYAETVSGVWGSFPSAEHDLRMEAATIRCPALVVWGRYDPVLPARTAGVAAARIIPGARLAVLDTGHTPFAEDPGTFLVEAERFLESLP